MCKGGCGPVKQEHSSASSSLQRLLVLFRGPPCGTWQLSNDSALAAQPASQRRATGEIQWAWGHFPYSLRKSYFLGICYKFFEVVRSIFGKSIYLLNTHVDWSSKRWTWTSHTFSSLSPSPPPPLFCSMSIMLQLIRITPELHRKCLSVPLTSFPMHDLSAAF